MECSNSSQCSRFSTRLDKLMILRCKNSMMTNKLLALLELGLVPMMPVTLAQLQNSSAVYMKRLCVASRSVRQTFVAGVQVRFLEIRSSS